MKRTMRRVVHKAGSFREADEWDIRQHTSMTPEERQGISRLLRIRYDGENNKEIVHHDIKGTKWGDDRIALYNSAKNITIFCQWLRR